MKKHICMFCGEPATLLCDGNLGFPPKDDRGRECIDAFHPYTCDAPMCRKCGTQMMRMFVSGRKPYAGIHTVDHCPICLRDLPTYPAHVRRTSTRRSRQKLSALRIGLVTRMTIRNGW